MESQWEQVDRWLKRHHVEERMNTLARVVICLYFLNHIGTKLEVWYLYGHAFPTLEFILLPASLLTACNVLPDVCAGVLAVFALLDAGAIVYNQFMVWMTYNYIYINELMVKKLALLGSVILILAQRYQTNSKLLFGAVPFAKPSKEMSTKKSVIMLIGRLKISMLVLYVGVMEIQRQMEMHVEHDGHAHSRRPHGDGHDNLVCKVAEFILGVPLAVGLKTNVVARLLALVLVLEAFTSWMWWTSELNIGYVLHAREHFFVNVGVAGGLLLLTFVGAGKFTVDELLKKNQ